MILNFLIITFKNKKRNFVSAFYLIQQIQNIINSTCHQYKIIKARQYLTLKNELFQF